MEGLSAIKATSLILGWMEAGNCNQIGVIVFLDHQRISQTAPAECWAGGLVLTDYRPYAFLRALFIS